MSEIKEGLYYHKGNGEKIAIGKEEVLMSISEKNGQFKIRNYSDGKVNESYLPESKEKAIVYMTSLICGYQPPRSLLCRDIPIPKTQSEGV